MKHSGTCTILGQLNAQLGSSRTVLRVESPILFEGAVLSVARTGVANYVAELAKGLSRRGIDTALCLATRADESHRDIRDAGVKVLTPNHRIHQAYWALDRLGRAPEYSRLACESRATIFANNRMFPTSKPSIATIHDLVHLRYPDFIDQRWAQRVTKRINYIIKHADAILVDSLAVRDEVLEAFSLTEERVHLVSCAANPLSILPRGNDPLTGPVIAVGTFERRKNLVNLVRAHQLLSSDLRRRHPLHLIGGSGFGAEEVFAAAQGDPHITLRQGVDQAELARTYASAALFVQASVYEGFGIPPLEAALAGVPVVCASTAVLREVTGDAAIAYFDPRSPSHIAECLENVLDHDHADRAAALRTSAARYTWEKSVEQLREVLVQLGVA